MEFGTVTQHKTYINSQGDGLTSSRASFKAIKFIGPIHLKLLYNFIFFFFLKKVSGYCLVRY